MSHDLSDLSQTYYELSSLYKNPTRSRQPSLDGKIASNRDAELAAIHRRLLALFKECEPALTGAREAHALYYKALALLYEVDDYRGVASPSVADLIRRAWDATLSELRRPQQKGHGGKPFRHLKANFAKADVRSLWKAKVLCGVAAIEIRRKSTSLDALLSELRILESFVEQKLHRPDERRPSWTMLAFVRAAQARVARQAQDYDYVQERLLQAVRCLDERAAELVKKLTDAGKEGEAEGAEDVEALTDDLVFIRQKQTLSSLFNVGLANLQRGFLRSAEYACQSARLQFRLHGQSFHRLYNDLILLSIKRASTSTENKKELCALKDELDQHILPRLRPVGDAGNPKLYLYGLREKAVIQSYCGESGEMLNTLRAMEETGPLSGQWSSRISILRARYCYQQWRRVEGPKDNRLLREALSHSKSAFKYATGGGLDEDITSYLDSKSLIESIEGSEAKSLIDTIESLITYGTVQMFRHDPHEAIKSAEAVVELSIDDNPRLLAMGYLVLAEAYLELGLHLEVHRHLANAKALEGRIDHRYVEDRRRAVENQMPQCLDLNGTKFKDAQDLLMGWLIDHSSKTSLNKIAQDIGLDRKTVTGFLDKLRYPEYRNFPHRHLADLLRKK